MYPASQNCTFLSLCTFVSQYVHAGCFQVIDTQTKLYLVLELGDGGDMYDYIMKHEGGLGEDKARKYFRYLVEF